MIKKKMKERRRYFFFLNEISLAIEKRKLSEREGRERKTERGQQSERELRK